MNTQILKSLKDCTIESGILRVKGIENYQELAKEFRRAVIEYEIEHYKVVAAFIETSATRIATDFITKPKGVSRSYAELVPTFRDVVFSEGGGNPSELKGKKFCNFFDKPGDMGFVVSDGCTVTTGDNSLIYDSSGMQRAKCLQDNIHIIKFGGSDSTLRMLLYKGKGVLDFPEIEAIIWAYKNDVDIQGIYDSVNYVPLSQVYDLSRFFTVKLFAEGDDYIKLFYKRRINEKVLEKILRDWAASL